MRLGFPPLQQAGSPRAGTPLVPAASHTTRTDHALTLCQVRRPPRGTWRLGHGPRPRQGPRTPRWLPTGPPHCLPFGGIYFSKCPIIEEVAAGI